MLLLTFLSVAGFAQIPTITSFTPTSGPIGTTVTITGTNFNATPASNTVYFGGVKATVSSATATSMVVNVPMGATFQPISVTNGGSTGYSSSPFVVTFGNNATIDINSFASKLDFSTGNDAASVAVADLESDGKLDIAVSCHGAANIGVFRNTTTTVGSIGLGTRADFLTGPVPYSLAILDVTADGRPEMAISNYEGNNVSILRNLSSTTTAISFNTSGGQSYTTGTSPYGVALGDLDMDGLPDAVAANAASNTISVIRSTFAGGSSNLSYAAKVDFASGTSPRFIALADIDNDGKLDIVTVNNGSATTSVFRNTSTGSGVISFATRVDFTVGTSPVHLAVGDVDGDGKADIVAVNSGSTSVSILRNTTTTAGSITMATKVDLTTGLLPYSVALGDVNGDGKIDIAVANRNSATASVFRNNSTSGLVSFSAKVDFTTSAQPSSVAMGDLDADGRMDLIVACENTSVTSGIVSILRNFISSTTPTISSFTPTSGIEGASITITGTNFSTIAANNIVKIGGVAANVTSATATSLVVTVPTNVVSGTISVEVGDKSVTSAGSFTYTPLPTITGFSPASGTIGTTVTITGTNFGATSASNTVYFGGVKATVTAATTTSLTVTVPAGAANSPVSVTTSGLTVFSTTPFGVRFATTTTGISTTSFSAKTDFATGTGPSSIFHGDFDGDGKLDVAVTNASSTTISIFRNTSTSGAVSLATKIDLTTSTSPQAVTVSDFDGDGKLDFAVANQTPNTVSIFRNTSTAAGSITFATRVDFSTGTAPIAVVSGDFDKDGKVDLATANYTASTLSVLRNTSTGTGNVNFATNVDLTTATNPYSVIAADIDGDQKLELVCTNYTSGSVSVFRNTSVVGTVSFQAKSDFGAGVNSLDLGAGDFDGDGKLDLAISANGSNAIVVYRNTSTSGTIGLTSAGSLASGSSSSPRGVSLGDFDGDGKLDISCVNGGLATVGVYRNTSSTAGTITFATKVDFATGTLPNYVFAGDIDGDGKLDLSTINNTSNTLSILRNALVTPSPPTITSFAPTSGTPGTLVTITGTNFSTTGTNTVSFNGLAGTVSGTPTATSISAFVPTGATTGKITVDANTLSVTSTGDFTVTSAPTITSFTPTSGPAGTSVTIRGRNFASTVAGNQAFVGGVKATLTSANDSTLVVTVPKGATSSPFTIVTNNSSVTSSTRFNLTFNSATSGITTASFATKIDLTSTSSNSYGVARGDFDGDGKVDLAVTNYTSVSVSLYRNTSSSTTAVSFATPVTLTTGTNPWGVVAADFNNDGKLDLAVANYGSASVSVFINTGTSTGVFSFSAKTDITAGTNPSKVAAADFDKDGRLDLVASNITSSTVSVFRNSTFTTSSVTFLAKSDFTTGTGAYDVTVDDLDGDGLQDLAVANFSSNTISVLRNTSSGAGSISFGTKTDYTAGSGPWAITTADLDKDGKIDVIASNSSSNSISVFRNSGTSSGTISLSVKADFATGATPRSVVSDDVDGDGLADVATVNYSAGTVSILRNTTASGTISLATKVDFTSSVPYSLTSADVDSDGKPDIVTANYTTTPVSVLRNAIITPTYARYSFTGGSTNDSESGGYNGTASSGALFSMDRYGNLNNSFEPEDDGHYIQINHGGAWNFNGQVAFAAWIRTNGEESPSSNFNILFETDGPGSLYIQGKQLVYSLAGPFLTTGDVLTHKQWHYVAFTIDGTNTFRIYLDGNEQQITYSAETNSVFQYGKVITRTSFSSSVARIGTSSSGSNNWYNGSIDDVRIYTGQTLSSSEITSIYNTEKPNEIRVDFGFLNGELTSSGGTFFSGSFHNASGIEITPVTTADRFGNSTGAILFQDNGNNIHVSHERSLNLRNNVTVNMWVKPTALPPSASFGDVLLNDNSGGRILIGPAGQILYHYPNAGATSYPTVSTPTGLIAAGVWNMVSFTITEDDVISIFVNGVSQSLTKNGTATNGDISEYTDYGNPDRFVIAQNDVAGTDNRYYNGAIDDFRVYQRSLQPSEISLLFKNQDSRMIAYYTFANNVTDYSGRGNNGTLNGATYTQDRFGGGSQALSFDGVDDRVTNSTLSLSGNTQFTFTAWINFKATSVTGYHTIIEFGDDSPIFDIADGYLELYAAPVSDILVPTNKWVHVAGTYNSGNVKLYLDGVNSYANTGTVSVTGVGMGIGYNGSDIPFRGDIDEVRIYNAALNDTEIADIYRLEIQTFNPPASPTSVTAKVSGPNSAKVSWVDNAVDETKYTVEVVQGGSVIESLDFSKDITSTLITGLTTGTTYTFNVLVTNDYGIGASTSNSVTPAALTTPIVTTSVSNFALNESVTITYFPARSYPVGDLSTATKIYMHSGLVLAGDENGAWDLTTVVGNWGQDDGVGQMTNNGNGSWSITITPTTYYGVGLDTDHTQIGMVFRNETGTLEGKGIDLSDIYIDVFNPNTLIKPTSDNISFDGDISTYLIAAATDPGVSTAWSNLSNFTIEAWVKMDTYTPNIESEIFARWRDYDSFFLGGYRLILYDPNDGSGLGVQVEISNGTAIDRAIYKVDSEFLGQFHHLAGSFDGSTIRLYVDGVLRAQQSSTMTINLTEGPNESIFSGYTFTGAIDELRLWNYARTTTELRSTAETVLSNFSATGLAGYWPLDELVTGGSSQYSPDKTTSANHYYLNGNVVLNEVADLSVSIVSQSSVYSLGNSGSIQIRLSNNAAVAAVASGVVNKVFLSSNSTLDGADLELYTETVDVNLAASSSANFTLNFTIPSDVSVGTYYLIVEVDQANTMEESDESNNVAISNSVEISELPPLDEPSNLNATSVELFEFTVSWTSVTDATGYVGMAAYDPDFIDIVVSPTSLTQNSAHVTGLDYGTDYYFAVKAVDTSTSRESDYSVLQVTTDSDTEVPTISFVTPVSKSIPETIGLTMNTSDNVGVAVVDFYKKRALATSFTRITLTADQISASQQFEANVDASDFDDHGVSFYAIAYDESGNASAETGLKTITRDIPTSETQTIPGISVGAELTDYQMIALPYTGATVSSVIDLDKDDEVWRISTWNNSSSSYNYSVSSFSPGVGYWLIMNDPSKGSLSFSGFSPVTVDEAFSINLRSGWNQIGNPFLQTLNWSEVRQYNIDRGIISSSELTQLYTYESGYTTSSVLNVYEGAFIESSSNVTLQIPISALSGNRVVNEVAQPRPEIGNNGGWEIVLDIKMPDKLRYAVAGFGQYSESIDGVDNLDLKTPMLFSQYVKAEFVGDDNLARSIHSVKTNDAWTMRVSSSYKTNTEIRMLLNGEADLKEGQMMVMVDIQSGEVTDLTQTSSVMLNYRQGMLLKFIKGEKSYVESEINSSILSIGDPYPNPTLGKFDIDVNLPSLLGGLNTARIEILDLSGKSLQSVEGKLNTGYNSMHFDLQSKGLTEGLYFIKLQVGDSKITKKVYLKSLE